MSDANEKLEMTREEVQSQADAAHDTLIETEQARWQEAIDKVVSKVYPNRDGGGCDSGDPLDLTLAEIQQAFNFQQDIITEQAATIERLTKLTRGFCEAHDADCDGCPCCEAVKQADKLAARERQLAGLVRAVWTRYRSDWAIFGEEISRQRADEYMDAQPDIFGTAADRAALLAKYPEDQP